MTSFPAVVRMGLVSYEYPPFFGGGIGTYAQNVAQAMSDSGHQVHVITQGQRAEVSRAESGPTVHRVPSLTEEFSPHPSLSAAARGVFRFGGASLLWAHQAATYLQALHLAEPLDIVEFPECFAEAYVALRLRRLGVRLGDLPMTVTLHTPIWEHHTFNLLPRSDPLFRRRVQMEDSVIIWADGLSSPTRALQQVVAERLGERGPSAPCDIIPYPIPSAEKKELPRTGSEREVLFVGRLELRKGVHRLVEAMVPLLSADPSLGLTLIGREGEAGIAHGSMRPYLESLLPARLRARLRFEGARPREVLLARYRQATVCVFPALWDNFPNVCCEAMSAGACVVVTQAGGLPEIVEHDRSGLVVQGSDPKALTAAIRLGLEDASLRRRLGQGAQERINSLCAPPRVAQLRAQHYQAVIARSRSMCS